MIYILSNYSSYKNLIATGAMIISALTFAYFIYNLYGYINEYSILSNVAGWINHNLTEANESRNKRKIEHIIENGDTYDKSVIGLIDRLITYSGIHTKIKWMTTEAFLTINIIVSALVIVGVNWYTDSMVTAIISVIVLDIGVITALGILSNINYIKIENQTMQFIGCIENFSYSNNDIITILEKASDYSKEPIRSAMKSCISDAKNCGSVQTALYRLERTFENKYYKLIIRSISTCSAYSCEYENVIKQLKEVVNEHITFEKEKREEYRKARMVIYALCCVGAVGIWSVCSITDTGFIDTIKNNIAIRTTFIIAGIIVLKTTVINSINH